MPRRRVYFENAMAELGGNMLYLRPGELHLPGRESVGDTAQVRRPARRGGTGDRPRAVPGAEVVVLPGREVILNGGCFHCITQQQPASI